MSKKPNIIERMGDKHNSKGFHTLTEQEHKAVSSKGGKACKIETRLRMLQDSTEGLAETEQETLEATKQLYLEAMHKEALDGDFKKLEFWERATGNNKKNHYESSTSVSNGDVKVTVEFPMEPTKTDSEESDNKE